MNSNCVQNPREMSPIEQTSWFAVATIPMVDGSLMDEVSAYSVERNRWSIKRRCEMRFRSGIAVARR